MAIVERDPWRMQYFQDVRCPADLFIPTEDPDAWRLFPEHRWIYDKMKICETQGIVHGPHGISPEAFPVFSKPVYNMKGMGVGIQTFADAASYADGYAPGHFWMELLEGDHFSTDVAVVGGEPQWWRHTSGVSLGEGMFDYWTITADENPELEAYLTDWMRRHLRGYSGIANFETIGGKIIEGHLRFADQWPDLYGSGWLDAVVTLYEKRRWSYPDTDRRTGYSVVLFGAHGPDYPSVPASVTEDILAMPEVSSVQITFHPDLAADTHAMPPGGFRLAIVNCWDLEVGRKAREQLALAFWSTQQLTGDAS